MRYSKNFERDYTFYLKSIDIFNFCGTLDPKYTAIQKDNAPTAKEIFYKVESDGRSIGYLKSGIKSKLFVDCKEASLFNSLQLCKSGVNFQIKQWAESRAEGTLPLGEFSKKEYATIYPKTKLNDNELMTLEWVNDLAIYHKDIETQYGLPEWVVKAVENQKHKFYK